ncbi:hypothetical protein NLJ89_g6628 [Agrocybe chaxingu]|uniref:Uncharacterized protein n=1 Tax=Agrocybe chaxingu TaxID=84603 RepID=A0A9W8MUG5_9AGAR|nr:hypothetical protein NLJ89_g6628 [Agrocybe chaxingu]
MFRSLVISSTLVSFSSIASGAFSPTTRAASEAFPFSPGFDIEAVTEKAVSLPSHSWEYGTATEALLELYDAEHSVFGRPFPIPTIQPQDSRSLTYAKEKIVIGTGANALSDGDGAVSDPASLGVGALMLGKTNQTYSAAAKEQADFIIDEAPRWFNGAISHRVSVTELW